MGIPEYRLPKDALREEIKEIESLGVEIKTNCRVGKDISFVEIQDNYEAVFLATGADRSWKLEIPGEDMDGVFDSIIFLRDIQFGEKFDLGKNVAVIGGGNAAIDAARTAKRMGADNVTIVYRRLRNEMPADEHEINEAEAEGISIRFLAAPIEIIGKNNKVEILKCQLMELSDFDKSGRRSPKAIENMVIDIPVDSVISAISQEPDIDYLKGNTVETKRGKVWIDRQTAMTSADGVFAGGDIVTGPATVIEAIGAGIAAAQGIDIYLGGTGDIPSDIDDIMVPAPPEDVDEIVETPRAKMATLPVGKRSKTAEVELGYSREEAVAEANRCLRCDATGQE